MDFIKEFMEKRGATRADQGNHSVFWVDVEHFNELSIEMW